MRKLSTILLGAALLLTAQTATAADIKAKISIKQPGNKAVTYTVGQDQIGQANVNIYQLSAPAGDMITVVVTSKADQPVYYNLQLEAETGISEFDSEIYLPGFWYHRNLRSPREAPSFHTSKAWRVREDRLSSPLSGIFSTETNRGVTVMHDVKGHRDALTTHQEGEVILSGETSLGYVGFDCEADWSKLCFGYPYMETPRRYIRKLTLAPPIQAFARLNPRETKILRWYINEIEANSYGEFVTKAWEYCFDQLQPQPVKPRYSPDEMKATLANYFQIGRAHV